MSGGGQNTTTTVQNADPWSAAQPYLKQVMGGAQQAYQSGQGFKPFPESTVVPYSEQTQRALQGTEQLASMGNPFAGPAFDQALGQISSGGLSPWQQGALGGAYDVATGAKSIGTEGDLRSLAFDSPLGATASGQYLANGNPYFLNRLNTQSGLLADDINRGFSNAGRYGSAAHVGELGRQVGDFRNAALESDYNRERQAQMAALGQQSGLIGQVGQVQGANIANQVGAGQSIADIGNTAANQALQWTAMSPSIYQSQFAPMQQLAGVGSAYEDQAARELQDRMTRFQMGQQEPWAALANYSGLLSGAGTLGGQTTQTTQAPGTSPAVGGLGGAIAGGGLAGMLGPAGAVGLANPYLLPLMLGGGLLGAFS